ncbi:unnamed protein product [Discosporangium mesarthrocarpum]
MGVADSESLGVALEEAGTLFERQTGHKRPMPRPDQRRLLLKNLLTILYDTNRRLNHAMDSVLALELLNKNAVTEAANLPRLASAKGTGSIAGARVAQWTGDITTLRVDAIVNAANSALLGCFQPGHACVDNAIHSAAGPRLRQECRKLMKDRDEEPTGSAQITPGFSLPATHVLHTVGPIIHNGEDVKEEDERLLASCYTACLSLAAERNLRSVAFPCVSAGLYGFPPHRAALVAATAVREWLEKEGAGGRIELVVFNTFRKEDAEIYDDVLPHVFNGAPMSRTRPPPSPAVELKEDVRRAAKVIGEASAVIVGAGAGMSASYGYPLNYLDMESFCEQFPAMAKRGMRCFYEMVGHPLLEAVERYYWGVMGPHGLDITGLGREKTSAYTPLRRLIGDRAHFVLTSNVDALFEKNGFDPSLVYNPQGDYRWRQCSLPCRPDAAWPDADEVASALLPKTDLIENRLHDVADAPKCPYCGGKTRHNLRAGSWFLHHERLEKQRCAWRDWVSGVAMGPGGGKVAIIEIGAGFNSPGVVRWPLERLASANENVSLVRINLSKRDAALPPKDKVPTERAVSVRMGAKEGLEAIAEVLAADGGSNAQ